MAFRPSSSSRGLLSLEDASAESLDALVVRGVIEHHEDVFGEACYELVPSTVSAFSTFEGRESKSLAVICSIAEVVASVYAGAGCNELESDRHHVCGQLAL